jgi:transposase-like protein
VFKQRAVQRMLAGEPVAPLSRELKVGRNLLYRWREAYLREGAAGFHAIGRPERSAERRAAEKEAEKEARISALERKVGQQVLVIDFLERAFKRVEGLRQASKGNGGTASMERWRP